MKSFIMLELPVDIKNELRNIQTQLPQHVSCVEIDKLHLTLRFLGIVTDQQKQSVVNGLGRLSAKRFNLSLAGVGKFDNFYKVVWVGVSGQVDLLNDLTQQVESFCDFTKFDFTFYPHITLGRSQQSIDISNIKVKPVQFQASIIHYIETRKAPTGTIYKSLFKQSLI